LVLRIGRVTPNLSFAPLGRGSLAGSGRRGSSALEARADRINAAPTRGSFRIAWGMRPGSARREGATWPETNRGASGKQGDSPFHSGWPVGGKLAVRESPLSLASWVWRSKRRDRAGLPEANQRGVLGDLEGPPLRAR